MGRLIHRRLEREDWMKTDNEKILKKAMEILGEFNEAEILNLCAMLLAGMSMDMRKEVNSV